MVVYWKRSRAVAGPENLQAVDGASWFTPELEARDGMQAAMPPTGASPNRAVTPGTPIEGLPNHDTSMTVITPWPIITTD